MQYGDGWRIGRHLPGVSLAVSTEAIDALSPLANRRARQLRRADRAIGLNEARLLCATCRPAPRSGHRITGVPDSWRRTRSIIVTACRAKGFHQGTRNISTLKALSERVRVAA